MTMKVVTMMTMMTMMMMTMTMMMMMMMMLMMVVSIGCSVVGKGRNGWVRRGDSGVVIVLCTGIVGS